MTEAAWRIRPCRCEPARVEWQGRSESRLHRSVNRWSFALGDISHKRRCLLTPRERLSMMERCDNQSQRDIADQRTGGRAAEGNGLLNRRTGYPRYRGFESRPVRFFMRGRYPCEFESGKRRPAPQAMLLCMGRRGSTRVVRSHHRRRLRARWLDLCRPPG